MNLKWKKLILLVCGILILACGPFTLVTPTSPQTSAPAATNTPLKKASQTPLATPAASQAPSSTAEKKTTEAVKINADNAGRLKQAGQVDFNDPSRLVWSLDGNGLTAFNNEGLTSWDGQTFKTKSSLSMTQPESLYGVASDGRSVAVSADRITINLKDESNGKTMASIKLDSPFSGLSFAPDGKTLATTSEDDLAATLWETASGKQTARLSGFQTAGPTFDVSFAPDHKTLVWHARAKVQLMDITSQKLGPAFEHEDFVLAQAVSDDGKLLATCSSATINGSPTPVVFIWDTKSGKNLSKIKLDDVCSALTFLPASHLLAGGVQNQVILWDGDTQKPLAVLKGHTDRIAELSFSADGATLASGSADNTIRFWRVNP